MFPKIILSFLLYFNILLIASNFNIDSTIFDNNYIIRYLGIEEGLPHYYINCIGEHPDGYLFVSTQEGLVLFNGYKFIKLPKYENYQILSRNLSKIYKDTRNYVWFISKYSPPVYFKGKKFSPVKQKEKFYNYIYDIIEHNKNIIIATDKGLCTIDNFTIKPLEFIPINETVFKLNSDGRFLFVVTKNNVYKLKYSENQIYISKNYNVKDVINIFNRNDELWFVTADKGIYVLKQEKINKLNNIHLKTATISYSLITSNNEIWLGTNKGIIKIDVNNNFYHYNTENILTSNQINLIFEDKNCNIWLCPIGDKITLLKRSFFFTFKYPFSKVNHNVFTFTTNKNFLLAGTYGYGLEIFNNKGEYIKSIYFPSKYGNIINTVIKVENHYWISTNDKIFVLNDQFKIIKTLTFPNFEYLGSLYYNKSLNKVFIGHYEGVLEYDLLNNKFKEIYKGAIITTINGDNNGNIYIGSENNGVVLYNSKGITNILGNDNKHAVVTIYIDKDNIAWMCVEGKGLMKYNPKDGKSKYITNKNGLYSNLFFAIEEVDNNFWFSCNSGIFKCSKEQIEAFFNNKIQNVECIVYNHNNGILQSEFNGGYNFASQKIGNYLLFANLSGVVLFNTKLLEESKYINVDITSYNINNKDFLFDNKITVPWSTNNRLEIFIYPIIFSFYNDLKIFYKLNNEKDWNYIDKNGTIIYTNLKPGKYALEISLSVDGKNNVTYKKIDILVEGVFYRSTWFLTIVIIILFVGIIYILDRIKSKKQLEREKKLQKLVEEKTAELKAEKDKALLAYLEAEKALKIAEEQKQLAEIERQKAIEANKMKSEIVRLVAHDLKNPLGAIQSFASYIFEDIDDDKEYVLEHAKHIKEAADNTLVFVSELLRMAHLESGMIKPNITETSITSLINNIVSQNVQIAYEKAQDIIFDNKIPENLLVKIDPLLTSEIITNYISNAIKYSPRGTQIIIRAQIFDNKLRIAVIDKGPGILDEEKSKVFQKFQKLSTKPTGGESSHGLGLSIVKLLAEVQGAEVGFESEYGKGSTFFVDFDLEKIS